MAEREGGRSSGEVQQLWVEPQGPARELVHNRLAPEAQCQLLGVSAPPRAESVSARNPMEGGGHADLLCRAAWTYGLPNTPVTAHHDHSISSIVLAVKPQSKVSQTGLRQLQQNLQIMVSGEQSTQAIVGINVIIALHSITY